MLVLPLTLMLIAAIVGAARDEHSLCLREIWQRLRLSLPTLTTWLWAIALSGFMYGGNWPDLLAVAAACCVLWKEKIRTPWPFAIVLLAVGLKRSVVYLQPALQAARFFDPSVFHTKFFSQFGPQDFMGFPLAGAWWIPAYYALIMLVCNIAGEELWWRGYVLPRQEVTFGKAAWLIHGVYWSLFHLFMQPTPWDTVRMAVTGLALSFVAQHTRSTWPGIVGHSFGNLPFFLNLVHGVASHR